jgi:hypothetical protein
VRRVKAMERVTRIAFALAIILVMVLSSIAPLGSALAYTWGTEMPIMTSQFSSESKQCIQCHELATPFVVRDWQKSPHYRAGVGCYECHKANGNRPDAFEHFGFKITVVVTPKQCARCHPGVVEEYEKSVHSFAGIQCYLLPTYPLFWVSVIQAPFNWPKVIPYDWIKVFDIKNYKTKLPEVYEYVMKATNGEPGIVAFTEDPTVAILGGAEPQGLSLKNAETTKLAILWGILGCMACHGAPLNPTFVKEVEKRTGKFAGRVMVPGTHKIDPAFIFNHGTGRINPDGSLGACESCHPYHSFSLKIVRKSWEACGHCHYGADHPVDEMYKSGWHGIILLGEGDEWAWNKRPGDWMPGRDFRAPTCAYCHMGAVYGPNGQVIYAPSHDPAIMCKWKTGMWIETLLRIPGMPDPGSPAWVREWYGAMYGIKLVYPEPDWKARRARCIALCSQCHTKYYAASFLRTMDWATLLVDYIRDYFVLPVATMLQEKGLFTPFDKIEVRNLGAMANRPAKQALAHQGPDYRWWHYLVERVVLWTIEWLENVYHRPAVRKKAPEIIEYIEKIMPWLKTQVEGEKIESISSLLPPKVVETYKAVTGLKLAFAPLVTPVGIEKAGVAYTFTVNVAGKATGVSPVAAAALLAVPAALVEAGDDEEEQ